MSGKNNHYNHTPDSLYKEWANLCFYKKRKLDIII